MKFISLKWESRKEKDGTLNMGFISGNRCSAMDSADFFGDDKFWRLWQ